MDTCLKTLAALLFFFYSKNAYASPNEQNIKAFSLCQPPTGLEICNQSCKESVVEKDLKKICQCDCLLNESLRCVEIEGKYARFCYDNQVCLPGTRDKVIKIDGFEDKILLTIEECPDGYFQPHPTNCSKSCSYRHVTRPSNMVQLYPGSISASEVAYCDSGQGWVSTGRTFFNVSLEAGSRMCRKAKDLCFNGSDLLPNGTCAVTCRPGYNRVPADQFNCKSEIRQSSVVPDIPVTTTQKQEPDPTEKEPGQQPTHDTANVQWTYVTLMVIIGVVVCIVAVVFGAVFYFNRRERRETKVLSISGAEVIELLCQQDSKPKTVQTIRKETNKTLNHGCTNITAENVVLYQKGNDGGEDEEETQPKVIV